MQFQDYLANECDNPGKFNCAGCGDDLKCLKKGPVTIDTFMYDKDNHRISRTINSTNDLLAYIDEAMAYNVRQGNPARAEIEFVLMGQGHGICPVPFFDDEILAGVNMADMAGKIDPSKYLDMPAALIQIINIVKSERNRLEKLRMANIGRKTH